MASSEKLPEYGRQDRPKEDVTAYRIVSPKWARSALSGEGARLYGGRWNSPGRPMVYLSSTRALAALELLVHLPDPLSRRLPRTIVAVHIPGELVGGRFWTTDGWREAPPGRASTDQGDDWLETLSKAVVRAPSALIPEEENLLLNPLHPDFSKITITGLSDFSYDGRFAGQS